MNFFVNIRTNKSAFRVIQNSKFTHSTLIIIIVSKLRISRGYVKYVDFVGIGNVFFCFNVLIKYRCQGNCKLRGSAYMQNWNLALVFWNLWGLGQRLCRSAGEGYLELFDHANDFFHFCNDFLFFDVSFIAELVGL